MRKSVGVVAGDGISTGFSILIPTFLARCHLLQSVVSNSTMAQSLCWLKLGWNGTHGPLKLRKRRRTGRDLKARLLGRCICVEFRRLVATYQAESGLLKEAGGRPKAGDTHPRGHVLYLRSLPGGSPRNEVMSFHRRWRLAIAPQMRPATPKDRFWTLPDGLLLQIGNEPSTAV